MTVSKRKLLRVQEGLAQAKAAIKLHISQSYLSLVENEKVNVEQDILQSMAKLFKCNLQDLY